MIVLESVATRRAPLALAEVSLAWEAGVHAIVAGPKDGGPLLLGLLGGLTRPRAGTLRVLDGSPADEAVRRRVARVPLEPALPEAMRVREVFALASAVRREPAGDAVARLASLGIEPLLDRRVRSLSREEARAVALAEALTAPSVKVVLVEEPLVTMDPRAAGRAPRLFRERAQDGCAVVLATASMRDASELADDFVALRGGRVLSRGACADALVEPSAEGASLRVVVRSAGDVPALVAALSREAEVETIRREQGAVRLRGRDASELARAASRAALAAGVELAELRIEGSPEPRPREPAREAAVPS